jgi:hypothetical protein
MATNAISPADFPFGGRNGRQISAPAANVMLNIMS